MTPTGFALGWRNHLFADPRLQLYVPEGFGTVTVGSIDALRDMRLSRRCTVSVSRETAGAASMIIAWDHGILDDVYPVQLVGLMNYSLAKVNVESLTWRAAVYRATSAVVNAPITVWDRPSTDFPAHLWHLLDEEVSDAVQVYIVIEPTFGTGGGSLSLTAGGLWSSPIWCPPDGLDASWRMSPIDPGVMGRSAGNQGYPRRRQRYRAWEGRAVDVPIEWAYGDPNDASIIDIQQLLYRVGTTEPCVLFPRSRNAAGERSVHLMHRLGVYGHFQELGGIDHTGGDNYAWTGARFAELM